MRGKSGWGESLDLVAILKENPGVVFDIPEGAKVVSVMIAENLAENIAYVVLPEHWAKWTAIPCRSKSRPDATAGEAVR